MIEANELRIGNWVKDRYNNMICVHSIVYDGINFYYDLRKPKYTQGRIYPIPLTEEILLKCGFEYILPYNKKDNWEMKLGDYRDSQELKLDGSDVFPTFLSSSDLIEDGKGVHIAICKDSGIYIANLHNKDIISLHQLQNVYFALTGKELEVKL